MITAAAIQKKDGAVYVGNKNDRHDTVFLSKPEDFFDGNDIMGFVTDTGEFLNRKDAAKHAFECGQVDKLDDSLISEQLW